MISFPTPIGDDKLSIQEIVDRIETLNKHLAKFWESAHGWAPIEAAGLLSKSRLDWQASLSSSLRLWLRDPPNSLPNGDLILGWTNLGSLIEGTLKLLLSVYYDDFQRDTVSMKAAGAFNHKKETPFSPDGLKLDVLKKYVVANKLVEQDGAALIQLVQDRRNAIHAFKDRPIGDGMELMVAIRRYLILLRGVNDRLPYPDGAWVPMET